MTTLCTETTFIQPMTLDTSAVYFYSAEEGYVIKVESVEWEIYPGNTTLDTCPNNGGKRIYPDKQNPTDSSASSRKKVQVRARITPAVAGQTVYFRTFDVDDPISSTAPIDDNDASGPIGGDNRGADGGLSATSSTTDSSGYATVEFTVSMQPGDNFRAFASCCEPPLSALTQTQVDSGTIPLGIAQSGMLTVWRRLWIERDSMSTIPDSEKWIKGNVNKSTVEITADTYGRQYSKFTGTVLVPYPGTSPNKDEFEGGNLYFKIFTGPFTSYLMGSSGGGPFRITRSKHVWGCKFEIWPPLTTGQLSTIQESSYAVHFEAQDDGNYAVFDSPISLGIGSLASAFSAAYIDAVYADDFNSMKITPFKREITALDMVLPLLGAKDLTSIAEMWTTRTVACFEGDNSLIPVGDLWSDVDMDPDGARNSDLNGGALPYTGSDPTISLTAFALYGISLPVVHNSSAVFMETIRDDNSSLHTTFPIKLESVTTHEMGHTLGIGEPHRPLLSIMSGPDNLMHPDPDTFNFSTTFLPVTINNMRSVDTW